MGPAAAGGGGDEVQRQHVPHGERNRQLYRRILLDLPYMPPAEALYPSKQHPGRKKTLSTDIPESPVAQLQRVIYLADSKTGIPLLENSQKNLRCYTIVHDRRPTTH